MSGESTVRAAHSLAADPGVDSIVIIGPASSQFYPVVDDPGQCDLLVVSGADAPSRFADSGVPMVWDGDSPEAGVTVWGASPAGLALALASREDQEADAYLAHPDMAEGRDTRARFPEPVGTVGVAQILFGGRRLLAGRCTGEYAAVMASGGARRVAMVDDAAFMTGVALAAGVLVAGEDPKPVWADALGYLTAAAGMGLVMAEDAPAA